MSPPTESPQNVFGSEAGFSPQGIRIKMIKKASQERQSDLSVTELGQEKTQSDIRCSDGKGSGTISPHHPTPREEWLVQPNIEVPLSNKSKLSQGPVTVTAIDQALKGNRLKQLESPTTHLESPTQAIRES